MAKPTYESTIHGISHEGRGITTLNGKTVFIAGALPNEVVTWQQSYKKKKIIEGKLLEVLTPSPDRIKPHCQHFGICGGCSMQHVSIEKQLEHKQAVLLDQLKNAAKVFPKNILDPINGTSWGYRHKARMGVRFVEKKQKVLVGFREKHANYLADLHNCEVLHPSVGKQLPTIQTFIQSLEAFQSIPQIEVAIDDLNTALTIRHLETLSEKDISTIKSFAKQHNFHILLQPGKPESIHYIWPENYSKLMEFSIPDHNIKIQFSPSDFTQVNPEINRKMINTAIELLDLSENDNVLDLFCGIGNFTLPMARYAKYVTGVEGHQKMVERGNHNAKLNNIRNTSFYASDLSEPIQKGSWTQQHYSKILIDPPRTGAKEILPLISQINPKTIVYVSCNLATLTRDIGYLVHDYGFTLETIGIINMFPHTSHVESIARLTK